MLYKSGAIGAINLLCKKLYNIDRNKNGKFTENGN